MLTFWIILVIVLLILSIVGLTYLAFRISSYTLIRKLSKDKKWLSRLISFVLVIACTAAFNGLSGSAANTVVMIGTVVVTSLLGQLITLIVNKILKSKKKNELTVPRRNLIISCTVLVLSALYLGIGFYGAHHVWVTTYDIKTAKDVEPLKIVLVSDLHVGTTFDGEKFKEHAELIKAQNPDLIIIAGDFVDGNSKRANTQAVCDAFGTMNPKYGIFFSYGNHDQNAYGEDRSRDFSSVDFASMLLSNNINILEDEIVSLENGYTIIGRRDKSAPSRSDIAELVKEVTPGSYIIDINHQPNESLLESEAGVDLVLQGHTHGGQLFPFNGLGELMGLDDMTYGLERVKNTDFIVSSGISDWALDFKSGTHSEIVVINIIPE